jgi:hypothetical protein
MADRGTLTQLLGHDFGSTPFGYEAVRQAAEQQGHQFLDRRRSDCAVCLLDLYPIADVRCPVHGLEAFLRERLGEPDPPWQDPSKRLPEDAPR